MAKPKSDYEIIKSIICCDSRVYCDRDKYAKEIQIYDVILSFDENGKFEQVWTFDMDEE